MFKSDVWFVWFSILAYLLGWAAYLELSPSMGNVWWRTTAEGTKAFHPSGLWATAIAPFKAGHEMFWYPSFWDVNPWPVLGLLGSLLYFLRDRSMQSKAVPPLHHVGKEDPMQASPLHPHGDDRMSQ